MDGETGQFSLLRPDLVRDPDVDRATLLSRRTLEQRGRSEDEVAARTAYLDLLDILPGMRVLDAGRGSGVVLRDLARRVAPSGRATGVDISAALLTVAARLTRA